jgi:hypothetical protein
MLADNIEKLINGNLHHNGGGGLELGDVQKPMLVSNMIMTLTATTTSAVTTTQ